jgi:acetyl-CoA carboxylase carboxyl transferase subunit beta
LRNELITICRMLMGLSPQVIGDLPAPSEKEKAKGTEK